MRATIRLGRFAGIPVAAHWSALALPLLVADILGSTVLPQAAKDASPTANWIVAAVVATALLASLVAHELAHAVVARRRGLTVDGITLWMLGGVTTIRGEATTPRADFEVAIAGPATSVLCGVASGGIAALLAMANMPTVVVAGAIWLAVTNGVLAAFNLLPGAPLDGGRVLRAVIWRRTGDRQRAEDRATRAGRATGAGLIAVGGLELLTFGDLVGGLWLAAIGWFLLTAARAEANAAQTKDVLGGIATEAAVEPHMRVVASYLNADVAAARAVADDVEFCPVVDLSGQLVGIVDVDRLARAAHLPAQTQVARLMLPLPSARVTNPDKPLVDSLEQAGGQLPLVVIDHGAITGVVTPRSVQRVLRRELVSSKH